MIIDFHSNFVNYKRNVLNNKGKIKWTCPFCGTKDSFHRHGTYNRNLIFFDNGDLKEVRVCIQRLRCYNCKHTQSIIPWDIIPYSIYSVKTIFQFYYNKVEEKSIFLMSKKLFVSYQILYYHINVFQLYVNKLVRLIKYIYSIICNNTIKMLYDKVICFVYLLFCKKPFLLNRSSTTKYKLFYVFMVPT